METAIGSKISDYLIKPVNTKQILLSIKKNLDTKKLITRETNSAYQAEFRILGEQINRANKYLHWEEIYRKLVYWELELERSNDTGMYEVFRMQKSEAGLGFSRYIRNNYLTWFTDKNPDRPLLSPVFSGKIILLLDKGRKHLLFRLIISVAVWRILTPSSVNTIYLLDSLFCSILPTVTQYALNAMFAV
jgi:hypothetical protein